MPIRFWSLVLLILLWAGLDSCKKEKTNPPPQPPQATLNDSCNTVEDCKAIGKYYVAAYSFYFDFSSGSSTYFLPQYTTISITEIRPGTIAFSGDSIFSVKFSATYDTLLPYYNMYLGVPSGTYPTFVWSDNSDSMAEIVFLGDTISATYYHATGVVGTAGEAWVGVKVH